ncbi:LysM peptidoglycan-binding domain-containing protein [Cytobacillus depressus]|uniref:LysM peptidoglycan-binding domain-containing protein n=1 Tax=Cytobacillus depressus TaxID=1602942 RepID=UPI001FE565B2|nr:LysM peptidoglycan-binding domain-containing protein [Cytobacillus depressus]
MNTISTKRKQRIAEMRKQRIRARNKKVAVTTAAGAITALILLNSKAEASSSVYTVKSKDTLYTLSKKYEVSVEQLIKVNGLTSERIFVGQSLLIPNEQVVKKSTSYTIQKGDTLYSLAKQYGVSVEDLKKKNNIQLDQLSVGGQIIVPAESFERKKEEVTYTVVPGDTLWGIAKRFGLTVEDLAKENGLNKEMVLIGQKLNVPGDFHYSKVEIVGAADSFTVEFLEQGKPLVLRVPYGTAADYQNKSGQKVNLIHRNGSVISVN